MPPRHAVVLRLERTVKLWSNGSSPGCSPWFSCLKQGRINARFP